MFSVPVGGGYSSHNVNFVSNANLDFFFTYNKNKINKAGFETGLEFLVGYLLPFENFDMIFLGNIGYSYDYFGLNILEVDEDYYFHSVKIGFDSKFLVSNFSIGLATGVKIPFGLTFITYSSHKNEDINYFSDLDNKLKLRMMPYFQISLDYIFDFDYTSLLIGPYLTYEFGLLVKSDDIYIDTKELSSIDFGLKISILLSMNNFINRK